MCCSEVQTMTLSLKILNGRPQEGLAIIVGGSETPGHGGLVSWYFFLNPYAGRLTKQYRVGNGEPHYLNLESNSHIFPVL